jgi:hypothetical protein
MDQVRSIGYESGPRIPWRMRKTMEPLKRLVTNPFIHLYMILLVGAAGIGWSSTLNTRRAYYQQLATYYGEKAARNAGPLSATRYRALSRKYQDAALRPWTLAPPRNPDR